MKKICEKMSDSDTAVICDTNCMMWSTHLKTCLYVQREVSLIGALSLMTDALAGLVKYFAITNTDTD